MIFGKYINRYYLKHAPVLLLGLAALLTVDYTLAYHPDTEIPAEWLEEHFGCPIELLGHGDLPHRVLKCHHHD